MALIEQRYYPFDYNYKQTENLDIKIVITCGHVSSEILPSNKLLYSPLCQMFSYLTLVVLPALTTSVINE